MWTPEVHMLIISQYLWLFKRFFDRKLPQNDTKKATTIFVEEPKKYTNWDDRRYLCTFLIAAFFTILSLFKVTFLLCYTLKLSRWADKKSVAI